MKILLGISGGVDSAFSAEVLKAQGFDVEAAVLKMHEHTDVEGAKRAAEKAGLKLHIIDCEEAFDRYVASYFAEEYRRGRTPSPCTVCNGAVKIAELIRYAEENGFDRAATGHYARIGEENGRYFIADGLDERKNQSYMLWRLSQEQIKKLIFPLGETLKSDVKEKAASLGIESAGKPESQDICFLPNGGYAEYVENRLGKAPEGNFIDTDGNVLGRHKGIIHYTVGQRRGLGIALGERMFVSRINPTDNTITLQNADGEGVKEAVLSDMVYQLMPESESMGEHRVAVKIRYAAKPAPATLVISESGAKVVFDTPMKAVTPGQSAVMYENEKILCGGVIAAEPAVAFCDGFV